MYIIFFFSVHWPVQDLLQDIVVPLIFSWTNVFSSLTVFPLILSLTNVFMYCYYLQTELSVQFDDLFKKAWEEDVTELVEDGKKIMPFQSFHVSKFLKTIISCVDEVCLQLRYLRFPFHLLWYTNHRPPVKPRRFKYNNK